MTTFLHYFAITSGVMCGLVAPFIIGSLLLAMISKHKEVQIANKFGQLIKDMKDLKETMESRPKYVPPVPIILGLRNGKNRLEEINKSRDLLQVV